MSENAKQKTKTASKKRDSPERQLAEAVKTCTASYQRWESLYENGGSDPFYTDGANLELVRNHIIWSKRLIAEACEALGSKLPEIYYREMPPEVASDYMAKPEEIREAARTALSMFEKDSGYRELLKKGVELSEKQKKQISYSAVIGYVSRLKTALQKDDLVTLRLYRRADLYIDSIRDCLKRVKELNPEPYQLTLFDWIA